MIPPAGLWPNSLSILVKGRAFFCFWLTSHNLQADILSPESVYRRIDNSPVAVIRLPQRPLIPKPALYHDPPRTRIGRIMLRTDTVGPNPLKKERDNPPERLSHNSPVPPVSSDTVANLHRSGSLTDLHRADAANRLVRDRPYIGWPTDKNPACDRNRSSDLKYLLSPLSFYRGASGGIPSLFRRPSQFWKAGSASSSRNLLSTSLWFPTSLFQNDSFPLSPSFYSSSSTAFSFCTAAISFHAKKMAATKKQPMLQPKAHQPKPAAESSPRRQFTNVHPSTVPTQLPIPIPNVCGRISERLF